MMCVHRSYRFLRYDRAQPLKLRDKSNPFQIRICRPHSKSRAWSTHALFRVALFAPRAPIPHSVQRKKKRFYILCNANHTTNTNATHRI
jgi:hypothetical protein